MSRPVTHLVHHHDGVGYVQVQLGQQRAHGGDALGLRALVNHRPGLRGQDTGKVLMGFW